MKQIYTTAVAMTIGIMTATSASGILPQDWSPRTHTPSATETQRLQRLQPYMREADNLRRPSSMPRPVSVAASGTIGGIEIVTPEIVTDRPSGESKSYSRNSAGYWSMYGNVYMAEDYGAAVNIVTTPGSDEVWLSNPSSLYACKGWVKAIVDPDGNIVFKGAQKVHNEYFEGADHEFYMVPLEFRAEEEGSDKGWWYPVDKEVRYQLVDGIYELTDRRLIYGICQINAAGNAWEWMGYGDYAVRLAPQTAKQVEAPANISTDDWTVACTTSCHLSKVGIDGNKIYIKGLMPNNPDAWTVGNISGNRAIFAVGQYLGEGQNLHHAYLFGGEQRREFVEEYGDYANITYATRSISFDYDAQTRSLTNCTGLVTTATMPSDNVASDNITVSTSMIMPTVRYIVRDPNCPPASPEGISFFPYDDNYGFGYVDFTFFNMDENGYALPKEDLYYRVFFNNKPHVFYPDEYANVHEPMTDVPYTLSDMFDFDATGYGHTFYYYADGLDFIGLQTVYKPAGGRELMSPILTAPLSNDAIDSLGADSRAVRATEWFDLQGRPVSNPVSGIYIMRTTYTDGSMSVTKSIIK